MQLACSQGIPEGHLNFWKERAIWKSHRTSKENCIFLTEYYISEKCCIFFRTLCFCKESVYTLVEVSWLSWKNTGHLEGTLPFPILWHPGKNSQIQQASRKHIKNSYIVWGSRGGLSQEFRKPRQGNRLSGILPLRCNLAVTSEVVLGSITRKVVHSSCMKAKPMKLSTSKKTSCST